MIFDEAEKIWKKEDFFQNPYFISLQRGEKEPFIRSQRAFYHAVAHFSKPMLILASRIDSAKARLQIIENIYEEHGEMQEEAFHEMTFKKWLYRLDPESQETLHLPCVSAFNAALTGSCTLDPIEKAVCCLGVIEYIFSHVSKFIADQTIKHGWLTRGQLIHYNLHADLDVKHAQDLFAVVEYLPKAKKSDCIEGIKLGAHLFENLYLGLIRESRLAVPGAYAL